MPDIRKVAIMAGAAFAAATLAGCTSSNGGLPGAATTTAGSGSTTPLLNDNSSVTFAPRPKDISLAGVDPCTLLTASQRGQFGLDDGLKHSPDQQFHGPTCDYPGLNQDGNDIDINTVPTQGIEYWLDPTLADNIKQVTVGGFPGLDITLKGTDPTNQCTTAVSMSQGQMVLVLFAPLLQSGTVAQNCAKAEQVAAAALTTLQTMK
ncbi:MAG TPA: DUF3558 domain-containing protein [Pseudonocardiaceae bacterium]|nr:DUF3558 domain-containing protein [Pseudonocardiaceae bacterium]